MDEQSGVRKALADPVISLRNCSPGGEWLLVAVASADGEYPRKIVAYPVRGGTPVLVCDNCAAEWSRDGGLLYVTTDAYTGNIGARKTYAIQLRPGTALPMIPPGGIMPDNIMRLPVVKAYKEGGIYPGSDPSTYAYAREATQRNIYRVPLP
jgi:hypothetical protein